MSGMDQLKGFIEKKQWDHVILQSELQELEVNTRLAAHNSHQPNRQGALLYNVMLFAHLIKNDL